MDVREIVKQMTLEEKVDQLNTGKESMYLGVRNERFGIPALLCVDGPKGPRMTEHDCCYPIALAQAATWDAELMEKVGEEFADQMKHHEKNQLFGPAINMNMTPLSGRNSEYYGEDPILSGKIAAAVCRGLEGKKIISTLKHFVGNDFETGRTTVNVEVPERVLQELLLLPFKIGIQEGGSRAVMTTYNSINGHYTGNNKPIMDALHSWGFDGIVISDWAACLENTGESLSIGNNVELKGYSWYSLANVEKALKEKSLAMETLAQRVEEVLRVKFDSFDGVKIDGEEDLEHHRQIARRLGTEGAVLLKNDNILPLKKGTSVALIGPMASDEAIIGNQQSSTIWTEYKILPADYLAEKIPDFSYTKGCEIIDFGTERKQDFKCTAKYYNNKNLEGTPVITREENQIQKRSFSSALDLQEGIDGNCYSFKGTYDYKVGNLSEISQDDEFTISLWVYYNEQFAGENQPFMTLRAAKSYFNFSSVGIFYGDKKLVPIEMKKRDWTHFVITLKDGKAHIYLNNKQEAELEVTHVDASEIMLGGNYVTGQFANCLIDEFRLYKTYAGNSMVEKLYNKEKIQDNLLIYDSCDTAPAILTESYDRIKDLKSFSASWEGTLKAEETCKYGFKVWCNGGVRFYVDGKCLCNQFGKAFFRFGGEERRFWLDLEKDKEYKIKIEMVTDGDTHISFDYYCLNYENLFKDAVSAAKAKDVAVVMVGVDQLHMQSEANDNETYRLPGYQTELINAVAKANPNTIVLLSTSGGAECYEFIDNVKGLLEIFYPGQECSNVIYSLLFGEVNPSGKLPMTYPKSLDQLKYDTMLLKYPDDLSFFGYRYYDKYSVQPQFPFGFGLSYTKFEYLNCKMDNDIISVDIKNTGDFDGAEVVQLYVQNKTQSGRPVKELKDFKKVFVKKGETKTVQFQPNNLWFEVYQDGDWVINKGDYVFMIGASSADIKYKLEYKM